MAGKPLHHRRINVLGGYAIIGGYPGQYFVVLLRSHVVKRVRPQFDNIPVRAGAIRALPWVLEVVRRLPRIEGLGLQPNAGRAIGRNRQERGGQREVGGGGFADGGRRAGQSQPG